MSSRNQKIIIALFPITAILCSFVFACATPFAALATLAAISLGKRDAFFAVALTWLANQAIGYGVLIYPQDALSFAWGAAIGVAAVVSLRVAQRLQSSVIAAFFGAFVAYEFTLFLVALTPLGGLDTFSPAIISQIALTNIIAVFVAYAISLLTRHRLNFHFRKF
jgi:hypothetical protein